MFGGGTPREAWLLTRSSHGKGKIVAGVGTPPTIGENLSKTENQGDNGSHECMSSGGTNLGRFQGIDPRGGAEFDENSPNLTEDIDFMIGTTLVRIEGPDEVQSSGMESKAGERSDIISSWCREAVEHALARANDGNADQGPVLKVSERTDQSIVGLVLRSHGRPRTIGADGCNFITKRERDWVEQSAN